ncbi:MAG: LptF/LptG family permease [Capsulimonadales bacterium]|nr:LptF/LptG family permease [Capsulimonadales bacterium]
MWKRSDRLVFGELLIPFFIGVIAFLMMLVGNTLYKYLETILREKWPVALVSRFLLLNIPTVLVMALPVALTLAISLGVSRLARDNEITVLRSVGMPLRRIFLPVYLFGAAVSLLNLLVFEKVTPWAWREQQNTLAVLDALPTNPADASRRIRTDDFVVTFAAADRRPDGKRVIRQVVLVRTPVDGTAAKAYPTILTAESAEYVGGIWRLKNVVYHRFGGRGESELDGRAQDGTLVLNLDLITAVGVGQPLTASFTYSLDELYREAKRQVGYGNAKLAREFETDAHLKLSFPLQGILFAFVAPLLSLRFARTGAFTGILLSLILVVFTLIVLLTLRIVAIAGGIPPIVAAWLPIVLFAVAGVVLHRSME